MEPIWLVISLKPPSTNWGLYDVAVYIPAKNKQYEKAKIEDRTAHAEIH